VEELIAQAAAKTGYPADMVERSAEARAKADGTTVEAVLAAWAGVEVPAGGAASPAADAPAAAAPVAAAPVAAGAGMSLDDLAAAAAEKSGMPAKLLMRSAEAKAKAQGVGVEVVLAEMAGVPVPTIGAPAAEAAAAPVAAGGGMSLDDLASAAAEKSGMPAKLLMRSAEAKAKAKGVGVEVVLAEMAGVPVPTIGAPAAAPAATAAAPAVAAAAPAMAPAPEGVRTQRLLTVVKSKAIQQVKTEPVDKVNTWPHLVAAEFVALMGMTAFLLILSVVINAPLLEAANFNLTPNPSKAPWYFLGLQELLSYFDPQIAGVLIPGLIGLIGLGAVPYIDRNPATRPSERKFAIMMWTFFLMGAGTLGIIGSFFRGPGFNFTYPWSDGVFFDDLLDWLE